MNKKSSKREYKDYVLDISDSIEKIEKFVEGFTLEDFKKDEKTIYAVIRATEIIGEAVNRIPVNIKRKHREVPWKNMAGMRNKLIHEYFGVNMDVVWKTIKEDIPNLKSQMSVILDELKIKKLIQMGKNRKFQKENKVNKKDKKKEVA